jgi:hypothetical protein
VAWAWWKLYGFPWDPRLWVAFFVHDLGYWGLNNMDGPEGEMHPVYGANIVSLLFDDPQLNWIARIMNKLFGDRVEETGETWWEFTCYHSRHLAKKNKWRFSKLCVADKMAFCLTPWWMYIPGAYLSGELKEYFVEASERKLGGRDYWSIYDPDHHLKWYDALVKHLNAWVVIHKDGNQDSWTEVRDHA